MYSIGTSSFVRRVSDEAKRVLYDGHQRREEVDVVGDVVTQDVGEATVVNHFRLFLLAHFERPDLN